MNKFLKASLIIPVAALLAFGALAALPAGAQEKIQEQCKLVRSVKIENVTIAKDVTVTDGTASVKDTPAPAPSGTPLTLKVKEWGTICLINTINTLTDWAFFLLLSIAFVFIAVAGFIWMTAGANPEKQGLAGKMIAAALVGIVIAIAARMIPAVLTGILL